MPIYEFECSECGDKIERILSRTELEELDVDPCPYCKGGEYRRVLSAPAPPQFGGYTGKARTAAKIKARNDAYHNSKRGQEEHRANVAKAHARAKKAGFSV